MAKWPKLVASIALLSPLLGWRAERRWRRLAQLPADPRRRLPSLSIIVPARDEAHNLGRLLPSLSALDYDGQVEIIVVDDDSRDLTAAIARSFGVRLISPESLPPGWHGKPYACHMGAEAARGEWLLFTDADTVHGADGPARAVSYALDQGLDGLSAFLEQEFQGLTDRLAIEVAMAGLFATLPDRHAALNGQHILLRREVYAAVGGFASVRNDPLEDLALGNLLFSRGFHVPLVRGGSLARVAMYGDRRQMWRGLARIGAGTLRWSGLSGLVTALFITAVMTPLLAIALTAAGLLKRRWVPLTWISAVAGLWPRSRSFSRRWHLLLAPGGALFVQVAATWGLISRLTGRGVYWKGRVV
jgi:chlorobactene glucosyltransferase